jgi:hypothetical protein
VVNKDKHKVFSYPASRIATIDLGQIALRKHHIAGLLEVDVTDALARLKEQGNAKQGVSFFAWSVKVIGEVIAENRYVHAMEKCVEDIYAEIRAAQKKAIPH